MQGMFLQDITVNTGSVSTDITANTGSVSTRYNSKYRECYYKIYH